MRPLLFTRPLWVVRELPDRRSAYSAKSEPKIASRSLPAGTRDRIRWRYDTTAGQLYPEWIESRRVAVCVVDIGNVARGTVCHGMFTDFTTPYSNIELPTLAIKRRRQRAPTTGAQLVTAIDYTRADICREPYHLR